MQCSWLILNSAPLCGQYIAPMGETFGNNPFSKGLASIMCQIPGLEAHFFVKKLRAGGFVRKLQMHSSVLAPAVRALPAVKMRVSKAAIIFASKTSILHPLGNERGYLGLSYRHAHPTAVKAGTMSTEHDICCPLR